MAPSLTPEATPTATPGCPAPRPPLSRGRLVLLAALSIVAAGLYVLTDVLTDDDPGRPPGASSVLLQVFFGVSFASAVAIAASLMRRRTGRRPVKSITFRPPRRRTPATTDPSASPVHERSMDPARYPPTDPRPSLAPAGIAAAVATLMLAATFALDAASRSSADRACTDSIFPESCRNDAGLPLATLGALCFLVFLGAGVTALVILATRWRRRDR